VRDCVVCGQQAHHSRSGIDVCGDCARLVDEDEQRRVALTSEVRKERERNQLAARYPSIAKKLAKNLRGKA
jgi:ribosome-binding protein aMBF1 (putative translation factor)